MKTLARSFSHPVSGLFISTLSFLGILSSCSQEDPSFTEKEGEYYSVDIEGSNSEAAIQPPEVSSSELEDLINDYDATGEKSSNVAGQDPSSCLSESFLTSKSKVKKSPSASPQTQPLSTSDQCTAADTDSSDSSDEEVISVENRICSNLLGTSSDKIVRLSGASKSLVIKGDDAIVVRAVGNSRSFTIDLSTAIGSIPGICIFEAGNQARVDLKIGVSVGRIVYIGRGNTSTGSIAFSGKGSLNSGIVNLKGNSPSLSVAGATSTGCSKISATGDFNHYTCD